MKIVSLLPSATEIVCALGLREWLVGISHECDYPANVAGLPVLTASSLPSGTLGLAEIDSAVSSMLRRGESIYQVDEKLLAELDPDLILTQALCDVCAVSYSSVCRAVATVDRDPRIVSLEPHSFAEVLDSISYVGELAGAKDAAEGLVTRLRGELASLEAQQSGPPVPLVYLEWLDPFFSAGHWVPELIASAGGRELLGEGGGKSRRLSWDEVTAADPDVLLLGLCGFDHDAILRQVEAAGIKNDPRWQALRAVQQNRVYTIDANAYFSRPGPRLVEGAAQLQQILLADRARHTQAAAIS